MKPRSVLSQAVTSCAFGHSQVLVVLDLLIPAMFWCQPSPALRERSGAGIGM